MATFQLVVIPSENVSSHPLHIGLTATGRHRLLGYEDDDKFVILTLRDSNTYHQPPFLYTVTYLINSSYLTDIDDRVKGVQQHLSLFVTEFFLNHYHIDKEQPVFLQYVPPLPLEKIILTTCDVRTYDNIVNSDFLPGLLEVIRSYSVLIRKNDVLLAPVMENDELYMTTGGHHVYLNINCLDCQPFSQGLITSNTEIMIVNAKINKPSSSSISVQQQISQLDISSDVIDNDDDSLIVSQFLANSPVRPKKVKKPIANTINEKGSSFQIHRLAVKLLPQSISRKRNFDLKLMDDDRHRIGVTFATLASLQIFNCSWIKLSVSRSSMSNFKNESDQDDGKRWRIAQVVALEDDSHHPSYDDGTVYISPLLLFNLLTNQMDMRNLNQLTAELKVN